MGLFGALFAGVSGLDSQSNKIGIISNNISNVNTVGYKQGQAGFDTLVVPSGTTSFSPGGVIGGTQQLINQQGIISATTSSTDAAISGGGFFVVNTQANGSGNTYYTRSGSFTQDSAGNFINSDGYYLQGLPINSSGVTAQANQQNLKTVSIDQSATGAATATSNVAIAANLNSAQTVLQGPGEVKGIIATDTTNVNNTGSQILVPSAANGLVSGDQITITSASSTGTHSSTYTYGGFTNGRSVLTAASVGPDNTALDTETSDITYNSVNGTASFQVPAGEIGNYTSGYASITGMTTGAGTATASELNGEWPITSASGTTVTVQLATTGGSSGTSGTTGTVSNRTADFAGNILDAEGDSDDFLGKTGAANFAADALEFSISTGGVTNTFSYNSTPNTSDGQFNSLNTLATAISNTTGLTSSVVNGQLYVSSTNAEQAVTFINGDAAGTGSGASKLSGINWVQELGLPVAGIAASTGGTFNSLSGLAAQINLTDPDNLIATVENPTSVTPTLSIHETNPLQTIELSDSATSHGGTGNTGSSLVNELGLKGANNASLSEITNGVANKLTTGILPATYDFTDNTRNMSSGTVAAQYSKDLTVYDAQGNSHTLALNFVKLNTNTWAVEVTAVPATDIANSTSNDGQVAYGTLSFNGNGELVGVTGSIASTSGFQVDWTNGATPSSITMNLGEGTDTGLIQTAAAFNFTSATQNGSPVGELTGVSIDTNGYVIASFSNGQTQKEFQVPLAAVNNPDGLESVSGDAYIQTLSSGIANLQFAGTSGVGTFTPSALEQSNVDLSTQLTDLIVAQQAYGANSKVLTVADTLLQELDQIIQ